MIEETLRNIKEHLRWGWIRHGTKDDRGRFCNIYSIYANQRSLWSAVQYECEDNPQLMDNVCTLIEQMVCERFGRCYAHAEESITHWAALPYRTQDQIFTVLDSAIAVALLRENPTLRQYI